jgi:addiction module HigA family antidote
MAGTAIHPGEHLAEELSELGMSAAELARQLGVPTNRITEILNRRRAIRSGKSIRALRETCFSALAGQTPGSSTSLGMTGTWWLSLYYAQAEEIRTSSCLAKHALAVLRLCGFDREFQSHCLGHGNQGGKTRISANR